MKCIVYNKWVNRAFAIISQVFLIFLFLTIFFFLYVVVVEKDVFQSQINLIVDDVMKDIQIKDILPPEVLTNKEALIMVSNGALAIAREKLEQTSDAQKIDRDNKNLIEHTGKILMLSAGAVIIMSLILLMIGFCLPLKQQIKESLVVVIFIAITEFIFLNFVVKKYISADPNKVKTLIAQAIHNYIQHRKPD